MNRENRKNWFWGMFLVLAGVLVVASQFVSSVSFGLWSILATVFLAAMLIQSILSVSFHGIFISVALLYALFQKTFSLPEISLWMLLLAAVLLGSGLSIIFRRKPKWVHFHSVQTGESPQNCEQQEDSYLEANRTQNDDDNHPYAAVSFGAASRYLHSTCLEDGRFKASFGALEVFFDQAQLSPIGATVFLDCCFGEIKLFVPRHWRIIDNVGVTLGGVTNDTRMVRPTETPPILTLKGTVSLGSIEIQYV